MHGDGLTGPQRAAVDAMIDADLAWQTPREIARAAGISEDSALDALADLDGAGWVVAWEEWPAGTVVTFTPLAAELLAIRIVEVGARERPRWARAGQPDPMPPKVAGVFRDFAMLAALVVDPSPGPAELAEAAEVAPPVAPTLWPTRARRDTDPRATRRAEEARARGRRKARRGTTPWSA